MSKSDTKILDPLTPEFLADPFTAYKEARESFPVMKVSGRFEHDFYVVTRYHDVKAVMEDHRYWTKSEGALLRSTEKNVGMSQDPPEFNIFKTTYMQYLGPKSIKRWSQAMHTYVDELLDKLVPKGQGDLHDDFARPLPVKVMATVLGLPFSGLDDYRRLTDFFLTSQFNEPDPTIGAQMISELYEFFDDQFALREQKLTAANVTEPTMSVVGDILSDDLLSVLIVAKYRGEPLNKDERRRTARGFFVGNDTFTSLFLNILYRLLEDRNKWEIVQNNRALIDTAIEESLRCDPPSMGKFRLSNSPVTLHGVDIPEHTRVQFAIASANRDQNMFKDPDSYRLDRSPTELRQHLVFGSGPHYCPGAFIAREEARIALSKILDRMPNLTLTETPKRVDPFNFWGFKTFYAQW